METRPVRSDVGSAVVPSPYEPIALVTRHLWVLPQMRSAPGFFWAGCLVISLLVTAGFAVTYEGSVIPASGHKRAADYFGFFGLLLVGAFMLIPVAIHWCSRIFLEWAKTVDRFVATPNVEALRGWYNTEMKFFEGSRPMLIVGAIFGLAADLCYFFGDYLRDFTMLARMWAYIVVFTSAFFSGCGVWTMLQLASSVRAFGLRFSPSIVVEPGRFGILTTGRALAQCWMIIGAVWLAYSSSALFAAPAKTMSEALHNYPVLIISVPVLVFIVGSFIYAQMPLHYAMLEYKRGEVQRVRAMLREVTPQHVSEFSKDRQETIDFLQRQRMEAEALPEWPFSPRALAGVGGAAASALLPPLLNLVLAAGGHADG
jgi:hypothetical protein